MTDHLLLKTLRILSPTILIGKRIGIVFFWMGEHADDRKIRCTSAPSP